MSPQHAPLALSGGRRRLVFALGSAVALGACAPVQAPAPAPARIATVAPPAAPAKLRVKVFPGAQNLGLLAALQEGHFRRQGLEVDLQFTQNSVELRNGLAAGAFEIAHAAVDNAVAMRDPGRIDVVIVSGGDNSMNELFVQPEISSIAQLRGRTLIVDAPDTAYALQARKILKDRGLKSGDYQVKEVGGTFQRIRAMQQDKSNAASMLNPPFSLQARASGLRSLGKVSDLLGPYQASGAFVLRPWAHANGPLLERYLAGWIAGTRWALAPANREAATALLAQRLQLERPLAEATYAALVAPGSGLARDAAFDAAGFARLLAIRAEIEGQWDGAPPPQQRFVDLQWYQRALARLDPPELPQRRRAS